MPFLTYDEPLLVEQLARMPAPFRVAFAALAAQRIAPAYRHWARRQGSDSSRLDEILSRLWDDLFGHPLSMPELDQLLAEAMSLLPEDDSASDDEAFASDAISAAAYALRARRTFSPQEAAWAARRAYEAADYWASQAPAPVTLDSDGQASTHPAVQAELQRQSRDVETLCRLASSRDYSQLEALRSRATLESSTFFGTGP